MLLLIGLAGRGREGLPGPAAGLNRTPYRTIEWMEKNQSHDPNLRRLDGEAEGLLSIAGWRMPNEMDVLWKE